MSTCTFARSGAVAVAAAALLVVPLAAPASASGPESDPAPLNGYRSVGYVMADTPVTRDYQIADIISTGAIDDITHINYAFGNVTTDLLCDITNPTAAEPASAGDEGDASNDYLRLVAAEDSVDGVADTADQALAGNFNQLRKLKTEYPDTKILISLGGWTWSDNFFAAAATPDSRAALVSSCIDLYLRGDLPVYGDQGGAGAAAGIFDGIDIDWEWPVTGGETGTAYATPADEENFLALMAEFRAQLDEYGAETDEHHLLTAFAPVGGWNTQGGWRDARLFDSVDFLNVQGYDFHGGWIPTTTGHQGNLFPDGEENDGLALAPELQAYLDAGARPDQINAGLAAYGQGWGGVTEGGSAWQAATGSLGTAPYYQLRDLGEAYFDAELGAGWRYDEATGQWWSLDTPASIEAKGAHVAAAGYGGVMWWDLSGDYQNELGSALGDTLRAAPVGPLSVPLITDQDIADVVQGDEFAFTAQVQGRGPFTFGVTDGALPEGLTVNAETGEITGIPTAPGSYDFSLVTTNAFGQSAPVAFSLVVTAIPDEPGDGGPQPEEPGDVSPQPGDTPSSGDNTGDNPSRGDAGDNAGVGGSAASDRLASTGADGAAGLLAAALALGAMGSGFWLVRRHHRRALAVR